jgi:hypothetical protein
MPGWYVFYFCSSPFSIEPEVLTSPRKLERFTVVGAWSDGAAWKEGRNWGAETERAEVLEEEGSTGPGRHGEGEIHGESPNTNIRKALRATAVAGRDLERLMMQPPSGEEG